MWIHILTLLFLFLSERNACELLKTKPLTLLTLDLYIVNVFIEQYYFILNYLGVTDYAAIQRMEQQQENYKAALYH